MANADYTAEQLYEVLPLPDVYKAAGVPPATGKRLRAQGDFVPLIRLSPQRWGAFRKDILAWLEARKTPEHVA